MNPDDLGATARHIIGAIGGGIVSAGIITSGQLTKYELIGGSLAIAGGYAWSLYQKFQARKALNQANGVPK